MRRPAVCREDGSVVQKGWDNDDDDDKLHTGTEKGRGVGVGGKQRVSQMLYT